FTVAPIPPRAIALAPRSRTWAAHAYPRRAGRRLTAVTPGTRRAGRLGRARTIAFGRDRAHLGLYAWPPRAGTRADRGVLDRLGGDTHRRWTDDGVRSFRH